MNGRVHIWALVVILVVCAKANISRAPPPPPPSPSTTAAAAAAARREVAKSTTATSEVAKTTSEVANPTTSPATATTTTEIPEDKRWKPSDCGDYYELKYGMTAYIYSPNFPNQYPPYSKCVWLIQVPPDHRVNISITYSGERYKQVCSDYVEVRDGAFTARLLGKFCDTVTNKVVISGNMWMWVMFRSDGFTGRGSLMQSAITALRNVSPPVNTTKPFRECRSFEFACRNRQCISMSYRCDQYNDCGCLSGCDEDGCVALKLSKKAQALLAIGTGLTIFTIVCLIDFIIEGKNTWLAAQAEAMREKEMLAEKQRRRANRAFTKFISGYNETSLKLDSNANRKLTLNPENIQTQNLLQTGKKQEAIGVQ